MKACLEDIDQNIDKLIKNVEEKGSTINQLESEMRLLEFNCSEKSLVSKEELRNVQKMIPELEQKLKA